MAGLTFDIGGARAPATPDADERPGLSARVEMDDAGDASETRVALVGWMDRPALRRLERALDALVARGVRRLTIDCTRLRHVDYILVPRMADALARFEIRSGAFALNGLSAHLRDLFRLAGCEAWLRSAASAAELDAPAGPEREYAP